MTFPTEAMAREFATNLNVTVPVMPTTHGYWTFGIRREPKTCSICGEQFFEFGNNALPVNDGRCCNYCDDHMVTPARIAEVLR